MSKDNNMIRKGWAVWSNTDLTEGKGVEVPVFICDRQATAHRLARKINVQGTNGIVREAELFEIDGQWYGPIRMQFPTREDLKKEEDINKFDSMVERAMQAGLTREEIYALVWAGKDVPLTGR